MNNLRRRPTYNELIRYLNNQPMIKYPERKSLNIMNDIVISNLLNDDDKLLEIQKDKLMLDKYSQLNYTKQNYDYFPDMYHIIDAESKYQPNTILNRADNINQTIRYMLKHINTPYSSLNSTPKPTPKSPDNTPSVKAYSQSPVQSDTEQVYEQVYEHSTVPIYYEEELTPIKKKYIKYMSESSSSHSLPLSEPDVYELMGITRQELIDDSPSISSPTLSPPISVNSSKPVSIASSKPVSIASSRPVSVSSKSDKTIYSKTSDKSIQ